MENKEITIYICPHGIPIKLGTCETLELCEKDFEKYDHIYKFDARKYLISSLEEAMSIKERRKR